MIDILIASLCLQLNNIPEATKYYTSCISTSQALSIQTKVKPLWEQFQRDMENKAKKETGEQIYWVAGMVYAYQQHGVINLNVGAKPFIDNISLGANPSGPVSLGLTWSF
jgi:hypothetical protein